MEKQLQFENFYDTAELSAAYFTSKPMVLVLGQYSTGTLGMIVAGSDEDSCSVGRIIGEDSHTQVLVPEEEHADFAALEG